MKKRIMAVLLCLCLVAALLPATAFAAETSTIQLGAGGIAKGDKVYFGQYNEEEVPWIALDGDGFLLCQYTIGSVRFRDCRYYYEPSGPQNPGYYGEDWDNIADDSQLKLTMDGLYNGEGTKLFSTPEQNAVAATALTAESMDYDGYVRPLTAYLYPLSIMEIYDYTAREYLIDEALLVTGDITDKLNGNEYGWWTRTNESWTGVVRVGGRDDPGPFQDDIRDSLAIRGVRPAFNLKMASVLFASAAVGGKSASGMGSALTAVPSATPTEWKLTLSDESRSRFSIATEALSSASATVDYAGAKTGANEYISAMIVDNGSVTYYGRIKSLPNAADASGTVTISIPTGVTPDADTQLKVFNEQFNGDKTSSDIAGTSRAYSDYASELKTVTAPAPTVTTVTVSPSAANVVQGGTKSFSATVTGTNSPAQTVTWAVTGGIAGTSIDTNGNLTVAAGEALTTLTVTATSTVDTSKSGTAMVTVTTPVPTLTSSGCTSFQVGGASDNAVFTVRSSDNSLNATNNYGSATLNGQPLDLGTVGTLGADGSVADGSLVVTINRPKLNTLTVGNYTLAITLQGGAFAGRTVTGVITVFPTPVLPKTGDGIPLIGLALLMLLSCGGVALLLTCKRFAKR